MSSSLKVAGTTSSSLLLPGPIPTLQEAPKVWAGGLRGDIRDAVSKQSQSTSLNKREDTHVPRQRTRMPPSEDHHEHRPQSQEEHHQRRTPIGGATVQCRPGCRSAKQNSQLQEDLDNARNEVHGLREQSQLLEQELELLRTELNDCRQQVILSEGECRNLTSECELLKLECSNAEEDLNVERWSAREAVEEMKQKSRNIAALRYENTQLLETKLELEQKLEADHQVHISLVMALQLDVKDSAMKYKVVRQELATAIAGWTSERERAVELQRKLQQVQPA